MRFACIAIVAAKAISTITPVVAAATPQVCRRDELLRPVGRRGRRGQHRFVRQVTPDVGGEILRRAVAPRARSFSSALSVIQSRSPESSRFRTSARSVRLRSADCVECSPNVRQSCAGLVTARPPGCGVPSLRSRPCDSCFVSNGNTPTSSSYSITPSA